MTCPHGTPTDRFCPRCSPRAAILALLLAGCAGPPFHTRSDSLEPSDSGAGSESSYADHAAPDALGSDDAGDAPVANGGASPVDSGGRPTVASGGAATGSGGDRPGTGGHPPGSGGATSSSGGVAGSSPFIPCTDPAPCTPCIIPNGVHTELPGCCRVDHVCGYSWEGVCGTGVLSGCPY
jgi:hypothetical protein